MKEKNIYFKDLPALLQQKILDMYGAENAAELGLDIKPWATVYEDSDEVGALGMFEPAVQLTTQKLVFAKVEAVGAKYRSKTFVGSSAVTVYYQ